MTAIKKCPKDLIIAEELIYSKCGFKLMEAVAEEGSTEYGAFNFRMNHLSIKYRVAKITPTKTGQFVTLWKRNKNGPIQPFDISDDIDFYIISTRNDLSFGQFIFPKAILHKKGVLSGENVPGKRALRVYPPWNKPVSKQAQKSQQWQVEYFLEITDDNLINLARAKQLLLSTE